MRFVLAGVFCVIFSLTQRVGAAEFSSLEERMSQPEFHASGLDKLSAEELKNLNAWLRNHPISGNNIDRTGFPAQDSNRDAITSRIDGAFSGWSGKTVFKLQNGQWWQQVESDQFAAGPMQNPEITIEPALLGSWLLKVKGYNRSVHVQRIH